MTTSVTIVFHNTTQNLQDQDQDQDRFFLVSDWSCSKTDVSDHITGLGSAVSSPVGFGAEPWPPKIFSLFSALRMASPDTIILYYCRSHKKWKILNPFNLESITVHLVRLNSQSGSGKWCMVFTAGKRRGRWGDSTLGGIPQAVPD